MEELSTATDKLKVIDTLLKRSKEDQFTSELESSSTSLD
jgi:hypothetical protein